MLCGGLGLRRWGLAYARVSRHSGVSNAGTSRRAPDLRNEFEFFNTQREDLHIAKKKQTNIKLEVIPTIHFITSSVFQVLAKRSLAATVIHPVMITFGASRSSK